MIGKCDFCKRETEVKKVFGAGYYYLCKECYCKHIWGDEKIWDSL